MSSAFVVFRVPLVYLTFRDYEWVPLPGTSQIRLRLFLSRTYPRVVVLLCDSTEVADVCWPEKPTATVNVELRTSNGIDIELEALMFGSVELTVRGISG